MHDDHQMNNTLDKTETIARLILKGFRLHFTYFQKTTRQAQAFFEHADLSAHRASCAARISYYDKRVAETIILLRQDFPFLSPEKKFWSKVKSHYAQLIHHHPQGELAETFYNSIFCNLFNYRYYNNDNIFIESSLPRSQSVVALESVYESYFPMHTSIKKTIKKILNQFNFSIAFENIHRDTNYIIKKFQHDTNILNQGVNFLRIDIVKSLFFRNKAAFIIGRLITENHQFPFIIPLLNQKSSNAKNQALIYVDTLITERKSILSTFGFYHSYFMVHTQAPSALVKFLQSIIPDKKKADLYSAIGFHKQGKNEFYRDFLSHLERSDDEFELAKGIEGLVMLVLDLPSFPYVFKIIKDRFSPVKNITRKEVMNRYLLVKQHDRVGRMADTLEFSNVALPKERISQELYTKLNQEIKQSITETEHQIIISHLYIERRVIPLNIHLESASAKVKQRMMKEFANAIKDMMVANIFPGDLLLKNFGVTSTGRVIYYDYDEVQYMTEMNFRVIPKASTHEQEFGKEPWFSVGINDVFPEEFLTFITTDPELRKYLIEQSPELLDCTFWKRVQQEIFQGIPHEIFSYPKSIRFCNYFNQSF